MGYFTCEGFAIWLIVGFGQYYIQRCIACRKDLQVKSEKKTSRTRDAYKSDAKVV